jgi:hypothetical protein
MSQNFCFHPPLNTQNFNICGYTKHDFSLRRLDMTGYHAGLDDDEDDFGLDDEEGYEPDWDDEDEEWSEGEDDYDLDPDDEEE